MSDNGGEFGAFLAGFVIGGLVGAATALILAPQSGSETRSQIANKGNELRNAGERRLHHVQDTVENSLGNQGEDDDVDASASQQRIVLDSGRQSTTSNDNGESVPNGEEKAE